METSLHAVLDHVAAAVPDPVEAEKRWASELGGGLVAFGDNGTFASRQLRFTGGGKLELLSPSPRSGGSGFVTAFLERFGAVVHHVTLKVPDLHEALRTVEAGGLDVVDVNDSVSYWKEGFLRPSQVGGIIVQIAYSEGTDEDWAARIGHTPQDPAPGAATLLGPRLVHPDLDRAAALWSLLGASVEPVSEGSTTRLRCVWPDSPLDVIIEQGGQPGTGALRFQGTCSLPADDRLGPAVDGDAPQ
jgi:catechol 2,3-dioxygenase-like lactoylglutathione lyase family enzyme